MMNGNGRGENKNRKNWRHRGGTQVKADISYPDNKKNRPEKKSRPKWAPAQLLTTPIPTPNCFICNKPIKELATAFTDKISGEPVHFDCARKRVSDSQKMDAGDVLAYIGGGRFGIIYFEHYQNIRILKIKKIIEFESKETRAPWRDNIADHFSLT